MRFLIFAASIFLWLVMFYVGHAVNSARVAEYDVPPICRELLNMISQTWPNLAILCCAAGLAGGMTRENEDGRWPKVTASLGAGFLVFLTMAGTQFGVTGNLGDVMPQQVMDLQSVQHELENHDFKLRDELLHNRYMRLAIMGSTLAFGASTAGTARRGTPALPLP